MVFFYQSLELLPGVSRDKYGNLDCPKEHDGLRGRMNYALALKPEQLTGTILSELLDWLRWGSEGGVMWECTLPELIQLIENWLAGNPAAPLVQFNPYHRKDADWAQLWNERGIKEGVYSKMRCRCGKDFGIYDFECQTCWMKWHEMEEVLMGPRGEGTYNLALHGADGASVASTVWTGRDWLFLVPRVFEENKSDRRTIFSPEPSLLDA